MSGPNKVFFWLNLIFGILGLVIFFLTNSFGNMAVAVFNLWAANYIWKHRND